MNFDDIRPYNDEEVKRVWQSILKDSNFVSISEKLGFPILPEFYDVDSVASLQTKVVKKTVETIVENTTDGLTISGLENLDIDSGAGHIYISSHRDIVMDPTLVIYALSLTDYQPVEIAVGDNLLSSQLIEDLMRANRSFIVKRNLPIRQQIVASKKLSAFIWQQRTSGQSIWIAQREGRAKDGNDFTNPAIITMLYLAKRKEISLTEFINKMSLVPVTISYEFDPCDEYKAKERFDTDNSDDSYEKDPGEDLNSIIKGILGHKGRVHVAYGTCLSGDYPDVKAAAADIDAQIASLYKLWPSNLAAYEELYGRTADIDEADRNIFLERVNNVPEHLRKNILEMYANPVVNQYKQDGNPHPERNAES